MNLNTLKKQRTTGLKDLDAIFMKKSSSSPNLSYENTIGFYKMNPRHADLLIFINKDGN